MFKDFFGTAIVVRRKMSRDWGALFKSVANIYTDPDIYIQL